VVAPVETNPQKVKAVIVYFVGKARVPPGKVQLFKWMYLADFTAYEKHGRPITGETYENFEGGPVPRTFWRNYSEWTDECVEISKVKTGLRFLKEEMRPKRSLDQDRLLACLDPSEREVLDLILETFGTLSGVELKRLTHRDIPYRVTARGDEIPYYLAPYRHFKKPDATEVDRYLDANNTREVLAQLLKTPESE
jgi:uncharacterized phage-associated protein